MNGGRHVLTGPPGRAMGAPVPAKRNQATRS
jgi:hypothetical protein